MGALKPPQANQYIPALPTYKLHIVAEDCKEELLAVTSSTQKRCGLLLMRW